MNADIEYSDFYKFITSLGIGLIGIALIVPWLFLREPFDLLTKQEDINALTPVAKVIVESRQVLVGQIISAIPWFSVISLILGFVLSVLGSVLWLTKNQRIIDRQRQADLEKTLNEIIKPVTEKELVSKVRAEVDKTAITNKKSRESIVSHAIQVEKQIIGKIEDCFSSDYEVLSNQRLQDTFFDILLVSNNDLKKDFFVEIKYIVHHLNYQIVQNGFQQLAKIKSVYAEEANRLALGYLLVVLPKDIEEGEKEEEYQRKLREAGSLFRRTKIYLKFVSEESIASLDCSHFRQLFSL